MKFGPDIIPKNTPPKGGWGLVGIPPGTPDAVAVLMPQDERWGGDGYSGPINRVVKFLLNQGVTITPALEAEIWEWANAQWCAKSPDRCRGKKQSRRTAQEIGHPTPMHWAVGFWQAWNAALAGNADPIRVNQSMVMMAKTLIRGPYGCAKCSKHWEENLAAFPVDRAQDITQARVWLWHVHNLTREGLRPTPYNQIARVYQWQELGKEELKLILAELAAPQAESTPAVIAA